YCGICGTDLHIYEGKVPFVKFPIIPGHEFSGKVAAIGSEVINIDIGEKVAVNPNLSCKDYRFSKKNYCFYCKKNRPHFCNNWEAIGVTMAGAFAEYVVCPISSVFKIPRNISLREAVFMEPIACCLHGLNRLNFTPKNTVLIIGAGPIGLLMTTLIKMEYKSRIIVSEPNKFRRMQAISQGADIVIDPRSESLEEIILNETEGNGVDNAIEAVGSLQTASEAIKYLNKGGEVLIFGVTEPKKSIDLILNNLYSKELSLFGSFTNPHENYQALEFLENKVLNASKLVSHELSLNRVEEGLMLLRNRSDNVLKILVKPEE
ncbi:MAG: alcohol dehydrogenase catalytic domain-containing protein, partial [Candidatus Hodarchaeales archaeon]